MKKPRLLFVGALAVSVLLSCRHITPERSAPQNPAVKKIPGRTDIDDNADRMVKENEKTPGNNFAAPVR